MANSVAEITVGSVWSNGGSSINRNIVVTAVEGDLVEYGFPNIDAVYYLTPQVFLNNFRLVPPGTKLADREKTQLLVDLREALVQLKAMGYGDQVYAMLDKMGV